MTSSDNRHHLAIYDGIDVTPVAEYASDQKSDGTMLIYAKEPSNSPGSIYAIGLHDGNTEIFSSEFSYYFSPQSNNFYLEKRHYEVNNGWIAYLDNPRINGQLLGNNFWSRSPEGIVIQRTSFSSISTLEALAENDEAMFIYDGLMYLSKADGELMTLGFSSGKALHKNNTWYLIEDNIIFELTIKG